MALIIVYSAHNHHGWLYVCQRCMHCFSAMTYLRDSSGETFLLDGLRCPCWSRPDGNAPVLHALSYRSLAGRPPARF